MPTRRQLANAIRALSMDAVQKANSGHPGMPMGMADIAQVLWADHLKHNPGNPAVGGPRPVRAVERARLDAAVLAAAPDGLSARHRAADELPAVRLAHRRPPGARPAPRHRDHHRAARPGPRQCGRHGAGGEDPRRDVQSPGPRDRRPPHVGVPRRRLPDGRRVARGLLARRHAEARQAHLLLRRQRHLDRRRGARLVHRRHAEALRGVRLARRPRRGWPRPGRHRARHQGGAGRAGPPVADLLQDHHRLGLAEQAGHRGHARRGARRGRGGRDPQAHRLAVRAVRRAGRDPGRAGMRVRPAPRPSKSWQQRMAAYRAGVPGARRRVRASR